MKKERIELKTLRVNKELLTKVSAGKPHGSGHHTDGYMCQMSIMMPFMCTGR